MQGVSEVIKGSGRVIVLEDDHVVSKEFLRFMNEALEKYEQNDEVACISGYVYPLEYKPKNAFFIRGADCWGWATWKNKWALLERDAKKLIGEIESSELSNLFNYDGSYPYMQMLLDRLSGVNNSWAILWYASAFVNNKLCLYPPSSLIQNIGNDGSGTNHRVWTNLYDVSLDESVEFAWPVKIEESKEGRDLFKSFFKGVNTSLVTKVRGRIGRFVRRVRNKNANNVWSGNYQSWQEAKAECSGYDSNAILNQVLTSVRKVVGGEAAYDRDGVAFTEFKFSPPLLSTFEHIYHRKGSAFSVLDFGGSLGSLFFQYRNMLQGKIETWDIVEQRHFVELGKIEFENEVLKFHFAFEDAVANKLPDVLILSSVLCYLEEPYMWINKFIEAGIQHVIVDRTAFIQWKADRLTIQKVPESIYKATYPAWFLNEDKFLMAWLNEYVIKAEFPDSIDGVSIIEDKICYRKGFYFERIK
jgi:putative methyltransferase (TIGR04325 family)